MRTALYLSAVVALLAIAAAAGMVTWQAYYLPARIGAGLDAQTTATRAELSGQITATRRELLAEVAATRSDLRKELAATRLDATTTIREFRTMADARLGDTLTRADTALATVEGIRSDLKPIMGGATTLLASATATSDQIRVDVAKTTPFVIGTIAATKITMGQTAVAMNTFNAAWPELLKKSDQMVANSNRTTTATAEVMHNFAVATHPLPRWLRVGLQIGVPATQMGAAAVGAGAAMGAFR